MTPSEIDLLKMMLDVRPAGERTLMVQAAAEYLRLHDAIQRLYAITPRDVEREADFLSVCPAKLADEVEEIVRRFLR